MNDLPTKWADLKDGAVWLDGKPVFDHIEGAKLYLLRDDEGELVAQIKVRVGKSELESV